MAFRGNLSQSEGGLSMIEDGSAPFDQFNGREMEILKLLASGYSDREIAGALFLSLNTIKWYNRKIYAKLAVCSRTQAVARALEFNLLDGEIHTNNGQGMPGVSQNDKADYT
jgi:ATP/maltotriose-dependent transcriptional regulator MalT